MEIPGGSEGGGGPMWKFFHGEGIDIFGRVVQYTQSESDRHKGMNNPGVLDMCDFLEPHIADIVINQA